MKILIVIVFILGNLMEKFDVIVVVGFDGIEIFEQDFIVYDGDLCDVGNMICDMGLDIILF